MKTKHKILLCSLFFTMVLTTGHTQEADYSWPLPERWVREFIPFPLKFAKKLHYPGVEEIHFMPGWRGDTLPEQRWSYLFFWNLDTLMKPDQAQLKTDLLMYFNGLTSWVIKNTGSPMPFQPASVMEFSPAGDVGTDEFRCRISILDVFFAFSPIELNVKISAKHHPGAGKTIFWFELSPKPFDDPVWKILDNQKNEFRLLTKVLLK